MKSKPKNLIGVSTEPYEILHFVQSDWTSLRMTTTVIARSHCFSRGDAAISKIATLHPSAGGFARDDKSFHGGNAFKKLLRFNLVDGEVA